MNIKEVTFNRMLAFSIVAALLTVSILTMPAASYAQLTTGGAAGTTTGTNGTATPSQNATTAGGSPLTFTLRTGDGGAAVGAAPTTDNATTKNISIMVNLTRGDEPPIQLPINATIPANVNSLDLCVSAMDIPETCQPVWSANTTNTTAATGTAPTIDLTQNATGGTAAAPTAPTPSSYVPSMSTPTLFYAAAATTDISSSSLGSFIPVSGSLIGIEDTTVNIPVTVIAPITLQVQNAQVCASALSSGDQTCNQIVLNPQQVAYTPVSVDMTSPTPTVTPAEDGEATTTTTPTQEPTTTTTTPTDTTEAPTTTTADTTTGTEGTTTTEEPTTPTEGEEAAGGGEGEEGGTTTPEGETG